MRRSVIGWLTTATLLLASLGGADPARADTVVVGASDDASVEERSPTRNFDGETTLRSDESPLTRAVLGFDIGAFDGTVTRALLRLWVVDKSWNGPAVIIIWQDNPFSPSGGALYRRLRERAVAFGRPVVLVHGDTHNHRIDQPWSDAPHFTRVETFGTSSSGRWVRATIDPRDPDVFAFSAEEP